MKTFTCLRTLAPLFAATAVSSAAFAADNPRNPFSAMYPDGTFKFPAPPQDGGVATPTTCSFILDDGTNENSIGLTATSTAILNLSKR